MINARVPGVVAVTHTVRQIRRPGIRAFWFLFALESILIGAALLAALGALPARTPLTQASGVETLRAAVWSRVDGAVDDPVVEVAPGVMVRSSAVRGFALGGETFYYYFEGRQGFDPLSRGKVTAQDIEVVVQDTDGERTLVIYRILQS
jgi:hypothetical protein